MVYHYRMQTTIPFISQLPDEEQLKWLSKLRAALPDETFELAKDISKPVRKKCSFAIVANPTKNELSLFPNLKWVQSLWAGVENLIQPSIEQGFQLSRMIDPQLTETMAEAVLAWSLYLHRKMPCYQIQQKNKIWKPIEYTNTNQCNIGILGLGELGKASAKRLSENGFPVLGWSRTKKDLAGVKTFAGQGGLIEMLNIANILVCLLPLTKETHGMVDKKLLSLLPKNASLINFARGQIVNTQDLERSLNNADMYHAVLDVFEQEPLEQSSSLWSNPKITILPHIAATTNIETATKIVAQNISDYRLTGKINSKVDLKNGY